MTYNLKNIKKEFKQKGIFYTPPELAELLKAYVDIPYHNVYDPTCGDGGLLCVFDDKIQKYGQEINQDQLDVAKDRLINFNGVCGDTLKNPAFLDMKFDLIMANPPFSIKWEPPENDVRFNVAPVVPTKGKADYAFLLHILFYLSDKGKAIVLNFPGVLYRGQREDKIRQWIIEQNWIERVVHIPGDTFIDTKIATALIVFNKNKSNTDIIFEDKKTNKERVVSVDEVISNDFNLSVSTYVFEDEKDKWADFDAWETQVQARNNFLKRLEDEIIFDSTICDFNGWDKNVYIKQIDQVLEKFRGGTKK